MAVQKNIFQKLRTENVKNISEKMSLFLRSAVREISIYKKTYLFYIISVLLFSAQMLKAKYFPIPSVPKDLLYIIPMLIILSGLEYLRRHLHKTFFVLTSNCCFMSYFIIIAFYYWVNPQGWLTLMVFFLQLLYAFYHAVYMLLVVPLVTKQDVKYIRYENILMIICAMLVEASVLATYYMALMLLH